MYDEGSLVPQVTLSTEADPIWYRIYSMADTSVSGNIGVPMPLRGNGYVIYSPQDLSRVRYREELGTDDELWALVNINRTAYLKNKGTGFYVNSSWGVTNVPNDRMDIISSAPNQFYLRSGSQSGSGSVLLAHTNMTCDRWNSPQPFTNTSWGFIRVFKDEGGGGGVSVKYNCPTKKLAFGKIDCGTFKGLPKGFIFTDNYYSINLSSVNSSEELTEELNSNTPKIGENPPRVMAYYPNVIDLDVSGGDPNVAMEGFSGGMPMGLTPKNEIYTIADGGLCVYSQLAYLKNTVMRVMLVDEDDNIYGTTDNLGYFRGFQVYVIPFIRDNTGVETGAIKLMLQYQTWYDVEMDGYTRLQLEGEVDTLREIKLKMLQINPNPSTSQRIYFTFNSVCGGSNISARTQLINLLASKVGTAVKFGRILNGEFIPFTVTNVSVNNILNSVQIVLVAQIQPNMQLAYKTEGKYFVVNSTTDKPLFPFLLRDEVIKIRRT